MSKILRFSIIILGFFSSWLIVANRGFAEFTGPVEIGQSLFQQGNPNFSITPTATSTESAEPTATDSSEPTATNTPITPTATDTPTATPTNTVTPTETPVPTDIPTLTWTSTPEPPSPTHTPTPTFTNTPNPPTATDTPAATPTNTPKPTETPIPTNTPTPTYTPTPKPINSPPTISEIDDLSIDEDTSTGLVSFQIEDNETPAANLSVSVTSSNSNLVDLSNIALAGDDANRTIKITPKVNKFGNTTISIMVSDGQKETIENFVLTVVPVNDAPAIDLNGNGAGTGFSTKFIAQKGKVIIVDADLRIQDIDNVNLTAARVEIVNLKNGASEKLSVDTSGTNLSANYNAGVLNITGNDTIANYQKVLRTTSYQNNKKSPNTTIREITFRVDDGSPINRYSNIAKSTVDIVILGITIEKGPGEQAIGSGGTAVFTIRVENVGNVNLKNVKVTDPRSPNCNRTIGNLRSGVVESYTCSKQNVMSEFINVATVEGKDDDGNKTTATDSARVGVDNPNIQIIKSPAAQTIIEGQSAIFEIFVVNTSDMVDLVNITVEDPNSPDCNRIGNHSFSNLSASETALYTCSKENVALGFTSIITVTGNNLLTQEIVQDSSLAVVDMLDINVELDADPSTVPSSGGPITFSITVQNSGTINAILTDLYNDLLGSFFDVEGNWLNNSCIEGSLLEIPPGGQFSCEIATYISGTPPSYDFNVVAEGVNDEEISVSDEAVISVDITDVPSINVDFSASKLTVPSPGGTINEIINIKNSSFTESITITSIVHSTLGSLDGIGNCEFPLELSAQEVYECQFSIKVTGEVGDNETHTIEVTGETGTKQEISDEDSLTINIISSNIKNIHFPTIYKLYSQPEEDNDLPCMAYPLTYERTYSFLADDENDWFFIDVDEPGLIEIFMENFEPKDGQLAVWSGESCKDLTINNAHNANFEPNKSVSFQAETGRYYIWVINFDGISYKNPYTLLVKKS